jgi:LmbE family N-acetylglucosaminyl deacetylase
MRKSARLFGARLIQWTLPDGGGAAGWAEASGGLDALVDRIGAVIEDERPDLLLTFDPRHGSTCHPDHRAAADLALQAAQRAVRPPSPNLVETVVTGFADPSTITLRAGGSFVHGTLGFDANQQSRGAGSPYWQTVLLVANTHRSQFDPAALRRLRDLPARQRAVFLAPAALALSSESPLGCQP